MNANTKMTARQFLQLADDPIGGRLELVDGRAEAKPGIKPRHSYVEIKLSACLTGHVDANDLGEVYGNVGIIFSDYDVRRPDVIFFAKDRLHLIGETAMEGPPDLCVEIISPASVTIDREEKFKQYEKGSVTHYWIVDPDARTIEGYKIVEGKYVPAGSAKNDETISLPPFESLEIKLGQLWQPR